MDERTKLISDALLDYIEPAGEPMTYMPRIALCRNTAHAFERGDLLVVPGWQPIEKAPKQKSPMIVVKGVFASGYETDPWCVWWENGEWQRWPHDDPPTHYFGLPPLPKDGEA